MADERFKAVAERFTAAKTELQDIHRAKHYSLWRQETAPRLNHERAQLDPFKDFCNLWIYTGDDGGVLTTPQFGDWAIDLLVEGQTSNAILQAFLDEVEESKAVYDELSPILGVQIDVLCELEDGVELLPDPDYIMGHLIHHMPFSGCGSLEVLRFYVRHLRSRLHLAADKAVKLRKVVRV